MSCCRIDSFSIDQVQSPSSLPFSLFSHIVLRLLVEGDDLYEYIDSAVHMISGFTYYVDTISPHMWSLCGPLLAVLHDWGIDYIAEIMVPLLNFMTKDVVTFLQGAHEGVPLVAMVLNTVEKIFENDE